MKKIHDHSWKKLWFEIFGKTKKRDGNASKKSNSKIR